jgi:cytochrome c oxidase subunit 1
MTTTALRTANTTEEVATPARQLGTISWKWMVTTDHKVIGNLYFISSMMFFFFGGILALGIRAELAWPGMDYLSYEVYNQFFTMHGAIMLLLFATPLFAGFANAIMPLQIGSPDVAFPRLNMISYWLYLFGGLIAVSGFLSPVRCGLLRLDRVHAAVGPRSTHPVSAATCGSWGCTWPVSARSSVRSTSSPRSSPCGRPA